MSHHRFAYASFVGPIPDGLQVCHRCDVTWCVRPDHLFAGTPADNITDKTVKGRQAHSENHGRARLTNEQVRELRRRLAAGEGQTALAREFGVLPETVYNIAHGKQWRHVV